MRLTQALQSLGNLPINKGRDYSLLLANQEVFIDHPSVPEACTLAANFHSYGAFFFKIFIYLLESQCYKETDRHRNLPSTGSLPKGPQHLELSQEVRAHMGAEAVGVSLDAFCRP